MTTEPENEPNSALDSVEAAVSDIADGKLVIVTDDQSRENEGDLIMAASKVKSQAVNMMIRYGSGIICVPTVEHNLRRLGLNPMVQQNREAHRTDFTVSVDAAEGITTGISAYDRTATISLLANPATTPEQLVQPGHVFPLRAKPGGVLQRAGHTEAAVDLATLAGLHPSGVLCEILNDDGTCARLPELIKFKKKFGLKLISIADLIEYRHKRDKLVEKVASQPFDSAYGRFQLHVFRNKLDRRTHVALVMGSVDEGPTLVRVHAENLLGDLFQATELKTHQNLDAALARIKEEKRGVLLYLEKPDGGLQIPDNLGTENQRTISPAPMDIRDYGIGAQILSELGLKQIRLLSNTNRKVVALDGYDLEIVEQIPLS